MDNNDCRWPVAIGTTESGKGRVFDYSKASNILVAGAPKQGKSTAIGTIVNVRLLHAKEPGPVFREEFDRYPSLITGLERALCHRVHFKIFVFDGKEAYIGSANLTGPGWE